MSDHEKQRILVFANSSANSIHPGCQISIAQFFLHPLKIQRLIT
jgi:hypothetical protein